MNARINFKEGSFDWKLKVLVHFLRVKRDWMEPSPLPPFHALFSSNPSDKMFKIAISLKIVQRSDKKNSCVNANPQDPEAGFMSNALGAYIVLQRAHLIGN
jgi:hypothetical protein